MPGSLSVLSLIIRAGSNHDSLFTALDAFLHKEKYYTKEDVAVIDAARIVFSQCFPKEQFPEELRYFHEREKDPGTLQAKAMPPTDGYYRPPYILFDAARPYSSTDVESQLGNNELRTVCLNAILNIHRYLNTLNQKAAEWKNKFPGTNHGIYSDACRFICLLIRNAFVVFSGLNLGDKKTSLQAEAYLEFLTNLVYREEICKVFAARSEIEGYGNPLSVINDAAHCLKKMDELIKHYRSRFGILEHVKALKSNITVLREVAFTFSVYILPHAVTEEADTIIENKVSFKLTEQSAAIHLFRASLSLALAEEVTPSALLAIEATNGTLKPATFTYDTRLQTWRYDADHLRAKDKSGVYAPFKNHDLFMKNFTEFCAYLKKLNEMKQEVDDLENVLGDSGNILAAMYFSSRIQITLATLNKVVNALEKRYTTMMKIAKPEHDRLVKLAKNVTDEEAGWLKNFRALNSLLWIKGPFHKVVENIFTNEAEIEGVLHSWCENPDKKINEFKVKVWNLVVRQRATVAELAKSDANYADLIRQLEQKSETEFALLSGGSLPQTIQTALSKELSETPPDRLSTLDFIENKLTAYACSNGYAFLIEGIHDSIRLPNDAPNHVGFNLKQTQPELHEERIQWMYSLFTVFMSDIEEQDKLDGLNQQINQKSVFRALYPGDDFQALMDEMRSVIQLRLKRLISTSSSTRRATDAHSTHSIEEIEACSSSSLALAKLIESRHLPLLAHSSAYLLEDVPTPDLSTQVAEMNCAQASRSIVDPITTLKNRLKSPFVKQLSQVIEGGFMSSDIGTRNAMLEMWKKLCYLDPKMRDYHVNPLREERRLAKMMNYLKTMSSELSETSPTNSAAMDAVGLISPSESALDDPLSAKNRIDEKIQASSTALKQAKEKVLRFQLEHFQMDQYSRVWGVTGDTALQHALIRDFNLSAEEAASFLECASSCLLQRDLQDVYLHDELDALLEVVLTKHGIHKAAEQDTPFWSYIIRGLLSLGASPLKWMKREANKGVQAGNELEFYLMVDQVILILSHHEHRAGHLGNAVVCLGQSLDVLYQQIQLFADTLYACVSSDDKGWFWKWMLSIESPLIERAKPERIALFCSMVNWIDVLLNQEIWVDEHTQLGLLQQAETLCIKTQQAYELKVGTGSWFFNDGFNSWTFLKASVLAVREKTNVLGVIRDLEIKSANHAKRAFQKENLSSEWERSKQELSVVRQAALNVQNKMKRLITQALLQKIREPLFLQLTVGSVVQFNQRIDEIVTLVSVQFEEEERLIKNLLMQLLGTETSFAEFARFLGGNENTERPQAEMIVRTKGFHFYPREAANTSSQGATAISAFSIN